MTLAALSMLGCTQTHVVLMFGDGGETPDAVTGTDLATAPATSVSIASYHTCAIAGGALFCWGANDEGRLGTGDTTARMDPTRIGGDTDWQAVAVSARASLALKRNGSLWSFGANDNGQLGVGDFTARRVPTPIGERTDWTAIATRFDHACALARDGSLWCWGANTEGQLGQDDQYGSSTDRPIPTAVTSAHDFVFVDAGQGHSCALRGTGTLWCWGRNSEGELGQGPNVPIQIRHPVQVGTGTNWQSVQGGQNFTCGLRAGETQCWGGVQDAAIPGGTPGGVVDAPLAIGGPPGGMKLSISTFGGCVIDLGGFAFCWGRNIEGQLGLGDLDSRTTPTALGTGGWAQLSVGRFSTCGVRDGVVVCMGDNRDGQLGVGDLERRAVPTAVTLQR